MKLAIYIDSDIDPSRAYGFFSQLKNYINKDFFELNSPVRAHVLIMNDDIKALPQGTSDAVRISLYSARSGSHGARLTHTDDIITQLISYRQVLIREKSMNQ
jgi:hypothetical protein